jgi:ketosteroid isomerase-like protein
LTDAGDQVVARLTTRGRGKQSGVETAWEFWQLWTYRDGKAVHGRGFTDRDEALEAAGLEE